MSKEHHGEYIPPEEFSLPLEQFSPSAAKRDEASVENLRAMGIHPHFVEMEIEAKLDIRKKNLSPDQVLREIKEVLESYGYSFLGRMESRENFVVYYSEQDDHKGKLVVRNRGASGFQVKQKSDRLRSAHENIIIKNEVKSPVFESMQAAKEYLTQKFGSDPADQNIESIVKRKMCKLTLSALGNDSVTRYFRVVADEVSLAQSHDPSDVFRQVEIEYKGSDSTSPDNLKAIGDQIEEIISAICSTRDLDAKVTTKSKRSWAKHKKA